MKTETGHIPSCGVHASDGGAPAAPCLLRAFTVVVSAFSFQLSAFSATPSVSATAEPAEVRPGGFTTFTITIEGGGPDAAPELKLPSGLDLASPNPDFGQQTSIINREVRQSTTLTWQISCSQPGEYSIAPQEISVGGMKVQTEEVRLIVKENPAYPVSKFEPMMTLETGKREFYVGEVVPITVNLYVHQRTFLRRVGLIELPKESFAIQRFPLQSEEGTIKMGGVSYRSMAYTSTLSALKPGKFKLGPATSEIIIEVPSNDGRLGHPFFTQTEPRKVKPTCNDIEVNVLPLPTEGVPKGFNNLVGDFEITMTAEPREVAMNDPIAVEMTIHGTGNFDAITVPTITDPDSWRVHPARRYNVQKSDNAMDGSPRSIGFSQIIIPKKKVTAIPPFEFSYFSPSKKKYVTLRTGSLPVVVKAPEQPIEPPPATAAATAKQGVAVDDEKVPTVKPKITDILAVLPEQPAWLAARPALWADGRFFNANLVAAGALALLVFGKLGFVAWRAHANSPDAPSRRLWRRLHADHLTRASFYGLAASYISARGLSGDAIQSILNRHHAVNYGRPTGEAEEQVQHDERADVLKVLNVER